MYNCIFHVFPLKYVPVSLFFIVYLFSIIMYLALDVCMYVNATGNIVSHHKPAQCIQAAFFFFFFFQAVQIKYISVID